jgi:hypothetical protein
VSENLLERNLAASSKLLFVDDEIDVERINVIVEQPL